MSKFEKKSKSSYDNKAKKDDNNGFVKIGEIDLNSKKLNLFMQICFFVIAGICAVIIFVLDIPRSNSISIGYIVLTCILYLIVHECIHILAMKIFSKEKIKCTFKFPTFAVGCNFIFSKRQFVIVAAAPVLLLGCVLLVLLFLLPLNFTFLFYVLLTMNFAGSSGDYLQIVLAIKSPENSFFQDNSRVTKILKKCETE